MDRSILLQSYFRPKNVVQNGYTNCSTNKLTQIQALTSNLSGFASWQDSNISLSSTHFYSALDPRITESIQIINPGNNGFEGAITTPSQVLTSDSVYASAYVYSTDAINLGIGIGELNNTDPTDLSWNLPGSNSIPAGVWTRISRTRIKSATGSYRIFVGNFGSNQAVTAWICGFMLSENSLIDFCVPEA